MNKYRIYFLIGMMLICSLSIQAQDQGTPDASNKNTTLKPREQYGKSDQVYKVVEKSPEYPGGMQALSTYLKTNIPTGDTKTEDQQRYFFSFIIEKDGSLTNIELLRPKSISIEQGIKVKQALTAITSMPNWVPGEQNGEKMAVKYVLPIMM